MPGLSAKYPIGDTSPLWRLIIGIDEALGDYRSLGRIRRLGSSHSAARSLERGSVLAAAIRGSRVPDSDRGW